MESVETQKKKIPAKKKVQTEGLRVHKATKKLIQTEMAKINKKDFGKKVKFDALIVQLLPLVNEQIRDKLRKESLSENDRLELVYGEYIKRNGATSKSEYLGLLAMGKLASLYAEICGISTDNQLNQ